MFFAGNRITYGFISALLITCVSVHDSTRLVYLVHWQLDKQKVYALYFVGPRTLSKLVIIFFYYHTFQSTRGC